VPLCDVIGNHRCALMASRVGVRTPGFYGLDVYSLMESLEEVLEYSKTLGDPEAIKCAENAINCFRSVARGVDSHGQVRTDSWTTHGGGLGGWLGAHVALGHVRARAGIRTGHGPHQLQLPRRGDRSVSASDRGKECTLYLA
jgi:hypothetical protein